MHWTEIARQQAGVTSRHQLLNAGYDAPAITTLVRAGRLEATSSSGVYRAAGSPRTSESAAWAVVLDTRGVLSFLSAARWWGIEVPLDGLVHVTVPDRRRTTTLPAVRIHRVLLLGSDVTTHRGMPITTRAETVLDCAGWLPLPTSAKLLDRALQQHWIELTDIQGRLQTQRGRWGNRRLAWLLRRAEQGAHSELERRAIELLRELGLVGWRANHRVQIGSRTFFIDLAFPRQRVAIELDGWAFHSDVARFQADRLRSNALVADGWTVLRFTWADVTQHPDQVRATLLATFGRSAAPAL